MFLFGNIESCVEKRKKNHVTAVSWFNLAAGN